jgi:hypothetical protein
MKVLDDVSNFFVDIGFEREDPYSFSIEIGSDIIRFQVEKVEYDEGMFVKYLHLKSSGTSKSIKYGYTDTYDIVKVDDSFDSLVGTLKEIRPQLNQILRDYTISKILNIK